MVNLVSSILLHLFSYKDLGKLSNLKSGKVWEISQREGGGGVRELVAEFPTFRLGIFQSEGGLRS